VDEGAEIFDIDFNALAQVVIRLTFIRHVPSSILDRDTNNFNLGSLWFSSASSVNFFNSSAIRVLLLSFAIL